MKGGKYQHVIQNHVLSYNPIHVTLSELTRYVTAVGEVFVNLKCRVGKEIESLKASYCSDVVKSNFRHRFYSGVKV